MESAKRENYQPDCVMFHDFINKLSVIIGSCDVVQEREDCSPECARRIITIRDAAQQMAEELKRHQCQLDSATRTFLRSRENPVTVSGKSKN
jgi:hypothetical protein